MPNLLPLYWIRVWWHSGYIETGQDGLLYFLTHDRGTGEGNLYRLSSVGH